MKDETIFAKTEERHLLEPEHGFIRVDTSPTWIVEMVVHDRSHDGIPSASFELTRRGPGDKFSHRSDLVKGQDLIDLRDGINRILNQE